MLSQNAVEGLFSAAGAVITDSHLVYTSGRHGSAYVNKDAFYPDTGITSTLCQALVTRAAGEIPGFSPATIVGPERGGIILSQWAAHHRSETLRRRIAAVYAEKTSDGQGFLIKPLWLEHIRDKHVVVIEDVLTTGGSAKKVVALVEREGGIVQAVVALCNRGSVTAEDLGVPHLCALLEVTLESWEEAEYPLCKRDVPINTTVGHGKEFLAR